MMSTLLRFLFIFSVIAQSAISFAGPDPGPSPVASPQAQSTLLQVGNWLNIGGQVARGLQQLNALRSTVTRFIRNRSTETPNLDTDSKASAKEVEPPRNTDFAHPSEPNPGDFSHTTPLDDPVSKDPRYFQEEARIQKIQQLELQHRELNQRLEYIVDQQRKTTTSLEHLNNELAGQKELDSLHAQHGLKNLQVQKELDDLHAQKEGVSSRLKELGSVADLEKERAAGLSRASTMVERANLTHQDEIFEQSLRTVETLAKEDIEKQSLQAAKQRLSEAIDRVARIETAQAPTDPKRAMAALTTSLDDQTASNSALRTTTEKLDKLAIDPEFKKLLSNNEELRTGFDSFRTQVAHKRAEFEKDSLKAPFGDEALNKERKAFQALLENSEEGKAFKGHFSSKELTVFSKPQETTVAEKIATLRNNAAELEGHHIDLQSFSSKQLELLDARRELQEAALEVQYKTNTLRLAQDDSARASSALDSAFHTHNLRSSQHEITLNKLEADGKVPTFENNTSRLQAFNQAELERASSNLKQRSQLVQRNLESWKQAQHDLDSLNLEKSMIEKKLQSNAAQSKFYKETSKGYLDADLDRNRGKTGSRTETGKEARGTRLQMSEVQAKRSSYAEFENSDLLKQNADLEKRIAQAETRLKRSTENLQSSQDELHLAREEHESASSSLRAKQTLPADTDMDAFLQKKSTKLLHDRVQKLQKLNQEKLASAQGDLEKLQREQAEHQSRFASARDDYEAFLNDPKSNLTSTDPTELSEALQKKQELGMKMRNAERELSLTKNQLERANGVHSTLTTEKNSLDHLITSGSDLSDADRKLQAMSVARDQQLQTLHDFMDSKNDLTHAESTSRAVSSTLEDLVKLKDVAGEAAERQLIKTAAHEIFTTTVARVGSHFSSTGTAVFNGVMDALQPDKVTSVARLAGMEESVANATRKTALQRILTAASGTVGAGKDDENFVSALSESLGRTGLASPDNTTSATEAALGQAESRLASKADSSQGLSPHDLSYASAEELEQDLQEVLSNPRGQRKLAADSKFELDKLRDKTAALGDAHKEASKKAELSLTSEAHTEPPVDEPRSEIRSKLTAMRSENGKQFVSEVKGDLVQRQQRLAIDQARLQAERAGLGTDGQVREYRKDLASLQDSQKTDRTGRVGADLSEQDKKLLEMNREAQLRGVDARIEALGKVKEANQERLQNLGQHPERRLAAEGEPKPQVSQGDRKFLADHLELELKSKAAAQNELTHLNALHDQMMEMQKTSEKLRNTLSTDSRYNRLTAEMDLEGRTSIARSTPKGKISAHAGFGAEHYEAQRATEGEIREKYKAHLEATKHSKSLDDELQRNIEKVRGQITEAEAKVRLHQRNSEGIQGLMDSHQSESGIVSEFPVVSKDANPSHLSDAIEKMTERNRDLLAKQTTLENARNTSIESKKSLVEEIESLYRDHYLEEFKKEVGNISDIKDIDKSFSPVSKFLLRMVGGAETEKMIEHFDSKEFPTLVTEKLKTIMQKSSLNDLLEKGGSDYEEMKKVILASNVDRQRVSSLFQGFDHARQAESKAAEELSKTLKGAIPDLTKGYSDGIVAKALRITDEQQELARSQALHSKGIGTNAHTGPEERPIAHVNEDLAQARKLETTHAQLSDEISTKQGQLQELNQAQADEVAAKQKKLQELRQTQGMDPNADRSVSSIENQIQAQKTLQTRQIAEEGHVRAQMNGLAADSADLSNSSSMTSVGGLSDSGSFDDSGSPSSPSSMSHNSSSMDDFAPSDSRTPIEASGSHTSPAGTAAKDAAERDMNACFAAAMFTASLASHVYSLATLQEQEDQSRQQIRSLLPSQLLGSTQGNGKLTAQNQNGIQGAQNTSQTTTQNSVTPGDGTPSPDTLPDLSVTEGTPSPNSPPDSQAESGTPRTTGPSLSQASSQEASVASASPLEKAAIRLHGGMGPLLRGLPLSPQKLMNAATQNGLSALDAYLPYPLNGQGRFHSMANIPEDNLEKMLGKLRIEGSKAPKVPLSSPKQTHMEQKIAKKKLLAKAFYPVNSYQPIETLKPTLPPLRQPSQIPARPDIWHRKSSVNIFQIVSDATVNRLKYLIQHYYLEESDLQK